MKRLSAMVIAALAAVTAMAQATDNVPETPVWETAESVYGFMFAGHEDITELNIRDATRIHPGAFNRLKNLESIFITCRELVENYGYIESIFAEEDSGMFGRAEDQNLRLKRVEMELPFSSN